MGLCLTSRKSEWEFDMGYFGFMRLRINICKAYDKELGALYEDTPLALADPQEYNNRIDELLKDSRFKEEDEDLLDFLFASDCDGSCGYKTAKKIYDLIKDIDFGKEIFTYAAYSNGNDYEDLKTFLKECYQKRRKITWC